jgi:hypothetical protein
MKIQNKTEIDLSEDEIEDVDILTTELYINILEIE